MVSGIGNLLWCMLLCLMLGTQHLAFIADVAVHTMSPFQNLRLTSTAAVNLFQSEGFGNSVLSSLHQTKCLYLKDS